MTFGLQLTCGLHPTRLLDVDVGAVVTSALTDTDGDFAAITFSEGVTGDGASPAIGDFAFYSGGTAGNNYTDGTLHSVTSYGASGTDTWTGSVTTATFDLSPAITDDLATVTFHYTPGANPLETTSSGDALGAIVAQVVTNNVVAQITSITVADQVDDNDLAGTYIISQDADISWALTTSATALTAANLRAGTGAVDNGTATWDSATGTLAIDIVDGLADGTYYFQAVVDDGIDADVVVSNGFSMSTASYTETLVTVPNGAYLDAPGGAPASTTSVLFFASYVQDAGLDARAMLTSFDGANEGVWSDYTGSDSATGVRTRFVSGGRNVAGINTGAGLGVRVHILVSCFTDGTDITLKASISVNGGAWADAFADATDTPSGATLDNIVAVSQRLLAREGTANNYFYGQLARLAMWTDTDSAEIADPGSSTVQANFTSGSNIVDPATARTAYGTPLYDFSGAASTWNAGTHDGSLGNFTKSGGSIT